MSGFGIRDKLPGTATLRLLTFFVIYSISFEGIRHLILFRIISSRVSVVDHDPDKLIYCIFRSGSSRFGKQPVKFRHFA
jgi:hypothetical protein